MTNTPSISPPAGVPPVTIAVPSCTVAVIVPTFVPVAPPVNPYLFLASLAFAVTPSAVPVRELGGSPVTGVPLSEGVRSISSFGVPMIYATLKLLLGLPEVLPISTVTTLVPPGPKVSTPFISSHTFVPLELEISVSVVYFSAPTIWGGTRIKVPAVLSSG